jgi:phenylacetate-CoA ligase
VGELEDRITKNLSAQLGVGVDAAMLTLEDILKFSSSVAKFPRTVKE